MSNADNVVLVTVGAGFIGSNFASHLLKAGVRVVNLDALTYAGNLDTLELVRKDPDYFFVEGDIGENVLAGELSLQKVCRNR